MTWAGRSPDYEGSARNFRRLVAEMKPSWQAEHDGGRRLAVRTAGNTWSSTWAALQTRACAAV